MKIEFRQAILPAELRILAAFDRKIFTSDHFPPSAWRAYDCWWLLLEGRKAGCCAFEPDVDFQDDLRRDGVNPRCEGSLYIASTGLLPQFRGRGLGRLMKAWQVSYARHHGFRRIATNVRRRNKAMIALNESFGFRAIRTTPRYYADPVDATVVMELVLAPEERSLADPEGTRAR
jgi:GNAT superfamily N-acetyltransferase